jgi:acyl-CoA synthetase (AMP-forming)/AMP-acid ligase II
MPLYHSSASILGFLSALESGSTFALGRKFSTKTFWQEVRESEATIIQYVGETCRYLLSAPPQLGPSGENLDKENKVRMAFGNGLRPDIWNKFKERFGIDNIAEFYSATEAAGMGLNYSRNGFSKGSIGRHGILLELIFGPPAIVELDLETSTPIRDAKGFCRRMPLGEPGELLYILDADDIEKRFQGYLNNSKANNSKIIKDVFKKGDAYFRTGDLVRVTNDGLLYFVDRIGDTYRWKSENVSTNEVAECISTHPSVQEANVYGVELPNHDGRAGCAALVLTEEASPQVMSSLAECAQRGLPRFAVPLFLRVTKSMDTTGTNKQQKHVLRSQGVDPAKVGEDKIYWLKDRMYVRFGEKDWLELQGGKVKL